MKLGKILAGILIGIGQLTLPISGLVLPGRAQANEMGTHSAPDSRLAWWQDARFGMFIHFGVSSAFGGVWEGKPVKGYSEWMMRTCKIPRDRYFNEVVKPFNPDRFNADEWVALARKTGMKYLIVTAKHHDGVAMYDTRVSDYKLTASAFKRDFLGEIRDACRRQGLKFGFYYSHAMDWSEADAPGNDWDFNNPGGDRQLLGGREWHNEHGDFIPSVLQYFGRKALPQIKELVDLYHPDLMWFDTPSRVPQEINALVLKYVHLLDPRILVNSRVAYHPLAGVDYEDTQDRPAEFYPVDGPWEALPTTNESYGYSQFDDTHKSAAYFIRLIAKAAARGGNLLLNMGPMGNGQPDPRDVIRFNQIGEWFAVNGESIYGTAKAGLPVQNWGETTRKEQKLYLHVFDWPADGRLVVAGLKSTVLKAYALADPDRKALPLERINPLDYSIGVGSAGLSAADTVVVLELVSPVPETDRCRLLLPGVANELRTFDCDAKSPGVEFGDGMAPNVYVKNITSVNQSVSWRIRLNQPARFAVTVEYQNAGKTSAQDFVVEAPTQLGMQATATGLRQNRIQVTVGSQTLEASLAATDDRSYAQTRMGTVDLPAGEFEIALKPVAITGPEFARPKSLHLKPATGNPQ